MDSNQPNWQYKPGNHSENLEATPNPASPSSAPAPAASPETAEVSWEAPEYIAHERSANWYMALILGVIVLSAATYLLSKDYFATGIIVVLGIIVAIYANRKPQTLVYQLTNSGMRVGEKLYPYKSFQSFSVVREPRISSITLMPLKRFNLPLSAFFEPQEEDKIVAAIGNHLPYEERNLDGVEKLSRRLRF